jgi:hypothetical protein
MKIGFAAAALIALAASAAIVPGAGAQPIDKSRTVPPDTCTAVAPPPPEFAGWEKPSDLVGARTEAGLPAATFGPGKAITAKLAPVDSVTYRKPVQKADGPAVYGALYRLKIAASGTYRVQTAAGPWIDLFKDDAVAIRSTAHGHGPACTGMAKYVDFPLQPGDYLIQFSESLKPDTEIMVVMVGK